MENNDFSLMISQEFFLRVILFSLPITIIFGYANMLISMFLQSVFGGRFRIGGKR